MTLHHPPACQCPVVNGLLKERHQLGEPESLVIKETMEEELLCSFVRQCRLVRMSRVGECVCTGRYQIPS